mmetsp:Transcript_32008/g.95470  ORF Transcript_32008/g.95470 Transcript_32008/m.95470 type:complete len:206 (-) Transcript_32008:316-933(-)
MSIVGRERCGLTRCEGGGGRGGGDRCIHCRALAIGGRSGGRGRGGGGGGGGGSCSNGLVLHAGGARWQWRCGLLRLLRPRQCRQGPNGGNVRHEYVDRLEVEHDGGQLLAEKRQLRARSRLQPLCCAGGVHFRLRLHRCGSAAHLLHVGLDGASSVRQRCALRAEIALDCPFECQHAAATVPLERLAADQVPRRSQRQHRRSTAA